MSEEHTINPSIVVSPPQKRRTNVKWEVIQTFPDVDAHKKWLEMKALVEQVVRGPYTPLKMETSASSNAHTVIKGVGTLPIQAVGLLSKRDN